MGVNIKEDHNGKIRLNSSNISKKVATYELVKTMRASIMVLGPLLAKFGEARVSLPGGCAIGARPVDLHIKGPEALGAEIHIEEGYIVASAKKLTGSEYSFSKKSVTGTANIIMAACLADGKSKILNSACEPEIVQLGQFLNSMGAKITGLGTEIIIIDGVESLGGAEITIMPDRIEVMTMAVASIITKGELIIENVIPSHVSQPIELLKKSGANIEFDENTIYVENSNEVLPISFETSPFPGIPTDIQAQLMVMNIIANGNSWIKETIFENRFMHALELKRMGADISIDGNTANIRGVSRLYPAPVMATDLRASAALILAGLITDGQTIVDRIYHLDRGYEKIEKKLSKIGAKVQRID
jgi:UDP-N-acetylglucosamine 1-carboxyvinyltransferase